MSRITLNPRILYFLLGCLVITSLFYNSFLLQVLVKLLSFANVDPKNNNWYHRISISSQQFETRFCKKNGETHTGSSEESKQRKGKGKGIVNHTDNAGGKEGLTDSFLDTVRNLQLKQKQQEEEVEVLSKDGYRTAKSIFHWSSASVNLANSSSGSKDPRMNSNSSSQNLLGVAGGGGSVSGENS